MLNRGNLTPRPGIQDSVSLCAVSLSLAKHQNPVVLLFNLICTQAEEKMFENPWRVIAIMHKAAPSCTGVWPWCYYSTEKSVGLINFLGDS